MSLEDYFEECRDEFKADAQFTHLTLPAFFEVPIAFPKEYNQAFQNLSIPEKSDSIKHLFEEIIKKVPFILIEGETGRGKSTLTYRIQQYAIEHFKNSRLDLIPIHLSLKETNPWDALKEKLKINKSFQHNRIFIIDGLDLLNSSDQKKLFKKITTEIRKRDEDKVIMTSRPGLSIDRLTYPFTEEKVLHGNVKDIEQEEIENFLNDQPATTKKRYDTFKQEISDQSILRIPLFFSIAINLAMENKNVQEKCHSSLPGKSSLIESFIKFSIQHAEINGRIEENKFELHYSPIIEAICLNSAIQGGRGSINFSSHIPEKYQPNFSEVINALKSVTLIRKNVSQVTFIHQQFYEFFSARELAKLFEKAKERKCLESFVWAFLEKPEFDEILVFACQIFEEKFPSSDLITIILNYFEMIDDWELEKWVKNLKTINSFNFLKNKLNKNSKGNFRYINILCQLGGKVEHKYVLALAKLGNDLEIRFEAIKSLWLYGDKKIVCELIQNLNDPIEEIRIASIRSLPEVINKEIETLLISIYQNPENTDKVRGEAIISLSYSNYEKNHELVFKALEHQQKTIQLSAISALGNIPTKKSVKNLVSYLEKNDSEIIRRVWECFFKLGPELCLPVLISRIKKALENSEENSDLFFNGFKVSSFDSYQKTSINIEKHIPFLFKLFRNSSESSLVFECLKDFFRRSKHPKVQKDSAMYLNKAKPHIQVELACISASFYNELNRFFFFQFY